MKKYFSFFFNIFFISLTFSQSIEITDFMRLNPYSNFNNPAYFIPYKGYGAFPGIANINFAFYNSSIIYHNLFETKNGIPTVFTPNKFLNSLPKNNWLNTDLSIETLGFGFRVGNFFFSFNHKLRMESHLRYSIDMLGFLQYGILKKDNYENYIYTSSSPAMIEFEPNINFYQEFSTGFQMQVLERLYIGARPKLLIGIFNLKTDKFNAKIYSSPDDYTIYGNYNVNMKLSSPFPLYKKDSNEKLIFQMPSDYSGIVKNFFSNNLGFAIDMGAVYRISQEIRVSASVVDLGFIKWKGTSLKMSMNTKDNMGFYEFYGITTTQIKNYIENGVSIGFDSIVNSNFSLNEMKSYYTILTSKIMLDGYFDLTPCNRFILQFKGYILGKYFLPQFSVAYNGTFFNLIDVVVSYSMLKKSFANLGIGLGFRLGPIHLYTGTDNILAAISILNVRKISATFGLLLDLPVKEKVKEPELNYLLTKKKNRKEECD